MTMSNEEFFDRLVNAIDRRSLRPNKTGEYIEANIPLDPRYIGHLKEYILALVGSSESFGQGWNQIGEPIKYKFRGDYINTDKHYIYVNASGQLTLDIDNVAKDVFNYQNMGEIINELTSGYISGLISGAEYNILSQIPNMVSGILSGYGLI